MAVLGGVPHPRDPKPYPPADELRALFAYDPLTGVITWRHRADMDAAWNGRQAGKAAGCDTPNGYKQIRLNGRGLRYHRVAWILLHGDCPVDRFIDHANGDPSDNRADNLRLATREDNQRNCSRPRTRDLPWPRGVVFDAKRNRFNAYIRIGGREKKNLGRFRTPEDAHAAYCRAAEKYHGEFARLD